jgi:hypothetical protein
VEERNKRITQLEERIVELELLNENKQLQAKEYEQWIKCISNSTLLATSSMQ